MLGNGRARPVADINRPDQHGAEDLVLGGLLGGQGPVDPIAVSVEQAALDLDLAFERLGIRQLAQVIAQRGEKQAIFAGPGTMLCRGQALAIHPRAGPGLGC
jgi:hypothetical protein